jgi:hypothetical protein
MWRKRRSALFIDFENVRWRVSPEMIASLTAWLEDGRFDEVGGKRQLVSKRIYWNSSAEKHREAFEAAGFEVILCEKFSSLKNGADIRMALDIIDSCWKRPEIKEYILFTTDSDFVPILQRLSEKSKLSTIIVDESRMASHTAFKIYADVLVPLRQLTSDAFSYRRQESNLLARLGRKRRREAVAAPTANEASAPASKAAPSPSAQARESDEEILAQAERAVLRIASRTPKQHVPRKGIERELAQIKGFKKSGASAYLGRKHYQGLMLEVAKRNSHVKVRAARGHSAMVMYVPD